MVLILQHMRVRQQQGTDARVGTVIVRATGEIQMMKLRSVWQNTHLMSLVERFGSEFQFTVPGRRINKQYAA